MGCNIPRPSKRPKRPDLIDGVLGAVTLYNIQKSQRSEPAPEDPPRSPYNCPNCCAPIVKDYCEYCGTRFGFSVVKVYQVPKRDEIEKLKERLYADDQIVMEFDRFHKVAYDLGDPTTWTEDNPVGIVDTKND